MSGKIKSYAAQEPKGKFEPFEFEGDEVRIGWNSANCMHCEQCEARYRIVLKNNFN